MSSDLSNPLLPVHERADAEMIAYERWPIVSTFGQPQAEYAAIRKGIALLDEPYRGVLELTGPDRHAFLGNLITNQTFDRETKCGLQEGQGVYAFLLNLQGRVVLDMNAIERGQSLLLEMDARLVPVLQRVLEAYRFSEKVTFRSRVDSLHTIALHGRDAAGLLAIEPLSPLGSTSMTLFDVPVAVVRVDQCGVPGYRLLVPTDSIALVWTNLIARHANAVEIGRRTLRPIGWAAFNTCRIEAGMPVAGVDFELASPSLPGKKAEAIAGPPGILAPETGLFERAVSINKGCYLGQEIVARMHARKALARQLAGFKVRGGALPIAGAPVLDEAGTQIGIVTSSTMSPLLSDAAIGLALLKRPHFESGRVVRIAAEGDLREADIVPLPFLPAIGVE